jgi:hypothetical protein
LPLRSSRKRIKWKKDLLSLKSYHFAKRYFHGTAIRSPIISGINEALNIIANEIGRAHV